MPFASGTRIGVRIILVLSLLKSRRWIRFSAMISVLHSLLLTLRTLTRSRADLQLEILALRHQLAVL